MVDAVKILGALLGGGGLSSGSGANILKSVLGSVLQDSRSGGLSDLLGEAVGGTTRSSRNNPLGGLLDGVLNGGGGGQSGAIGDILGSVLGGDSQRSNHAGGLDSLLGGLSGGGAGNDLGSLVSAALNQFGNSEKAARNNLKPRRFSDHSPDLDYEQTNQQATLILRAMINAAKADGRLDENEKQKITGKLGQIDEEELAFINNELAQPLDTQAFVDSIPKGLGKQIYAMSLTTIDLDTNPEAQYLHELAQGLDISPEETNRIHSQLGAPVLYT